MSISQAGVRPVDPVFAKMVVGALQDPKKFIARQALPVINVDGAGATGTIFLETEEMFMGDPSKALLRAPGAAILPINTEDPGTTTYSCRSRSAKTPPLPKELIRRSQLPMDLKARNALALANALMVQEEVDAAANLFAAATGWTTATAAALAGGGGLQWTAAASTPITALSVVQGLVRDSSNGNDPDTLIIGVETLDALKRNREVRGFIATDVATAAGSASALASGERVMSESAVIAVLRNILEIPNIFVGKARRRTGIPPAVNQANIWTDNCWMGHLANANAVPTGNGNLQMSTVASAMFLEQNVEAGVEWDYSVQSWVLWTDESYDIQELNTDFGYLLTDTNA